MIKSPCLDCPDRHRLCHSECEKYKAFRALKDAENERMRQMNESKAAHYEIGRNVHKEWLRRQKRGGKL